MKSKRVRLGDPEAAPLLSALHQEYVDRYGPLTKEFLPAEEFDTPDGAFLVLMDGDVTVAGGGIRRHSKDTCEVRRVWTHKEYRRQGHALRVLAELEDIARELGYERARLETGSAQPEAEALYRGLGYQEIDDAGVYPDTTVFERVLTGPAA